MSINPELFYKKPDTQPNLAEKIREEKQSTLARRIGAGAAIGAGAYGTALGVKQGARYVTPVVKRVIGEGAKGSIFIPDFYASKNITPKNLFEKALLKVAGPKQLLAFRQFLPILTGTMEESEIDKVLTQKPYQRALQELRDSGYIINNRKDFKDMILGKGGTISIKKTKVGGLPARKIKFTEIQYRPPGLSFKTAAEFARDIEQDIKIRDLTRPKEFKNPLIKGFLLDKNFKYKPPKIDTLLDRFGVKSKNEWGRAVNHERLLGYNAKIITAPDIDKLNKSKVNRRGIKMTFAQAMNKDGLSKVVETDYKTLFKGHERAISRWKAASVDNPITLSLIQDTKYDDKQAVLRAGKKDILFKATKQAMQNTGLNASQDQVDDMVDNIIRKYVDEKAGTKEILPKKGVNIHSDYGRILINKNRSKALLQLERINPGKTAENIEIYNNWKNKYYTLTTKEQIKKNIFNIYEKARQYGLKDMEVDGKKIQQNVMNLNFNPARKPHFLSGGMNYSVNFFRNKNISNITIDGKKIQQFKVFHDMLVTDDFDMYQLGKIFQRNVHFNAVHDTNIGKKPTIFTKTMLEAMSEGAYSNKQNDVDKFNRIKRRDLFQKALKDKNYPEALKHAKRLGKKAVALVLRLAKIRARIY